MSERERERERERESIGEGVPSCVCEYKREWQTKQKMSQRDICDFVRRQPDTKNAFRLEIFFNLNHPFIQ